MSGISYRERNKYHVDNQFIQSLLSQLNTIALGTIVSINESSGTAMVSIFNQYSKINQQGQQQLIPYPTIEANLATLSLFQYTPSPGDNVLFLASQSDITNFPDGPPPDGHQRFNLYDGIAIPISFNYSGVSGDVNIDAKDVNITVNPGFKVTNANGNMLELIYQTLTAIGNVTPNPSMTIDASTGGIITANVLKLETFNV